MCSLDEFNYISIVNAIIYRRVYLSILTNFIRYIGHNVIVYCEECINTLSLSYIIIGTFTFKSFHGKKAYPRSEKPYIKCLFSISYLSNVWFLSDKSVKRLSIENVQLYF